MSDASRAEAERRTPVSETFTVASASNRLSSVAGGSTIRSLAYDAAGNVTGDDRGVGADYGLAYNDNGRLVALANGVTPIASYEYNAFEQRVVRNVALAPVFTRHYVHMAAPIGAPTWAKEIVAGGGILGTSRIFVGDRCGCRRQQ